VCSGPCLELREVRCGGIRGGESNVLEQTHAIGRYYEPIVPSPTQTIGTASRFSVMSATGTTSTVFHCDRPVAWTSSVAVSMLDASTTTACDARIDVERADDEGDARIGGEPGEILA